MTSIIFWINLTDIYDFLQLCAEIRPIVHIVCNNIANSMWVRQRGGGRLTFCHLLSCIFLKIRGWDGLFSTAISSILKNQGLNWTRWKKSGLTPTILLKTPHTIKNSRQHYLKLPQHYLKLITTQFKTPRNIVPLGRRSEVWQPRYPESPWDTWYMGVAMLSPHLV